MPLGTNQTTGGMSARDLVKRDSNQLDPPYDVENRANALELHLRLGRASLTEYLATSVICVGKSLDARVTDLSNIRVSG
jgi:hypothetical protein